MEGGPQVCTRGIDLRLFPSTTHASLIILALERKYLDFSDVSRRNNRHPSRPPSETHLQLLRVLSLCLW